MKDLKQITEFGDGYYYGDIGGNVYSKRRGYLKRLSGNVTVIGYVVVTITGKCYKLPKKVHRLIAKLFIPNPDNKPQVNHKDGNKENNRVSNLEWCTSRENHDHAIASGLTRRGESVNTAKLTEADVIVIRKRLSMNETYRAVYEDYKDVLGWWTFRDLCRGKNWKHINC